MYTSGVGVGVNNLGRHIWCLGSKEWKTVIIIDVFSYCTWRLMSYKRYRIRGTLYELYLIEIKGVLSQLISK